MRKRLQPLPRCAQQPITRAAWRKHRPETDPCQASSQSAGDGDVLLHSELAMAGSADHYRDQILVDILIYLMELLLTFLLRFKQMRTRFFIRMFLSQKVKEFLTSSSMTSKLQAKHDLLHDAIQKGTSAGKSTFVKPPATLKITRYYSKVHKVSNAVLVSLLINPNRPK